MNGTVGRPVKKETVNNIATEQYRLNSTNSTVIAFGFNKTVSGVTSRFEIVSTDIDNGTIIEEAILPEITLHFYIEMMVKDQQSQTQDTLFILDKVH